MQKRIALFTIALAITMMAALFTLCPSNSWAYSFEASEAVKVADCLKVCPPPGLKCPNAGKARACNNANDAAWAQCFSRHKLRGEKAKFSTCRSAITPARGKRFTAAAPAAPADPCANVKCGRGQKCEDGKCVRIKRPRPRYRRPYRRRKARNLCRRVKCPDDQECDPATGQCRPKDLCKANKVECKNGGTCNPHTGICRCPCGYAGNTCESCACGFRKGDGKDKGKCVKHVAKVDHAKKVDYVKTVQTAKVVKVVERVQAIDADGWLWWLIILIAIGTGIILILLIIIIVMISRRPTRGQAAEMVADLTMSVTTLFQTDGEDEVARKVLEEYLGQKATAEVLAIIPREEEPEPAPEAEAPAAEGDSDTPTS